MSEPYLDEYDQYNFEQDRFANSSHSGKQRTKREVVEHTNRPDISNGHTRKLVTKFKNTETNRKGSK